MVIKVLGLDKLVKKLDKLGQVNLDPPIRKGTQDVWARAINLAPRRGGYLSEHIYMKGYDSEDDYSKGGEVYATANYSIYQEFGTRYQSGTPFMRPAMLIEGPQIKANIAKYIKEVLKK